MKKTFLIALMLLTQVGVWATEPVAYDPYAPSQQTDAKKAGKAKKDDSSKVLTGFSFGLLGNIGYGFSQTPKQLYNNGTIRETISGKALSKSNITLGGGLMGRLHLFNHMHLGAEGYLSLMPMMSSGSSVRHGYAGALIDGYFTMGPIVLELGTGLGGGKVKRLFVPEQGEQVSSSSTEITYNASYTTTPYFYLDPYIGVEIHFGGITGMLIKFDYVLPFGKGENGGIHSPTWSSLITPAGPRLHVGVLVGGK